MCCGLGCDGCQVSAMRGEGGGICTTWNRNYQVCVMLTLDSNCALVNTNEIERFSCVFRWRIQLTRQSRWEIMSYPPQQNLQKCFLPLTKQKRDLVSFGCGCQDIMSPTNSLTLSCNQNQGRQKMGAWRSTTFTLVQFRLSPTLSSYWLFLTRHFCYNRENKSQKKKRYCRVPVSNYRYLYCHRFKRHMSVVTNKSHDNCSRRTGLMMRGGSEHWCHSSVSVQIN